MKAQAVVASSYAAAIAERYRQIEPARAYMTKRKPGIAGLVGLYVAWLVAAGMLVSAAVERHPHSFYTLLRWICCPIFAYSAFAAHEKNRVLWVWCLASIGSQSV
jgi:Family of unknown function (DUF6804)